MKALYADAIPSSFTQGAVLRPRLLFEAKVDEDCASQGTRTGSLRLNASLTRKREEQSRSRAGWKIADVGATFNCGRVTGARNRLKMIDQAMVTNVLLPASQLVLLQCHCNDPLPSPTFHL